MERPDASDDLLGDSLKPVYDLYAHEFVCNLHRAGQIILYFILLREGRIDYDFQRNRGGVSKFSLSLSHTYTRKVQESLKK